MKKWILGGVVGVVASLVNVAGVAAVSFSDVDTGTTYGKAILKLAERGVIEGHFDGSFRPEDCVNRAEMVKLILEMGPLIGGDNPGEIASLYYNMNAQERQDFHTERLGDSFYMDVGMSSWYMPYAIMGTTAGIIEGYSDGTFRPGNCVNRVEAIKMTSKFFDGQFTGGVDVLSSRGFWAFEDMDKDAWYWESFSQFLVRELLGTEHIFVDKSGRGGGLYPAYFYPGEGMSRAEVAEMLYRVLWIIENGVDSYTGMYEIAEDGSVGEALGYIEALNNGFVTDGVEVVEKFGS